MRSETKKQNNKNITQRVKELGQLCPTVSSKVLRNFLVWRQKKPKQMRVETQEKQPMISIAFNCGMKNGKNQVLEEYLKETIKKSNSSQKMPNAFQKILQNQKRNRFRESPNMTFMSFKTRKTVKESSKKIRTDPSIHSSFQTDFYPRELADLQQQIKDLPSVQERRKTTLIVKAKSAQKKQRNFDGSPQNQKISPQKTYYSQKKRSKNHFFIDRINHVISCTDDLIDDQESISSKNTLIKKTIRKQRNYRPQMSVSLPLRIQPTNFYQQQQGNQIVNELKRKIQIELQEQQAKMNKQIVQTEKNALENRFKYKLSIQRQKYKRNIRSFIKCKQDYRIERRREQVRANGIRRVKKVSNNDKKHKPKPEDD